jgi:type VI secretion system protein ImpH
MDAESWHSSESVAAMAEDEASSASDSLFERGIYRRLLEEGYRFRFFQAVRFLELLYPEAPTPGETTDVEKERIQLLPSTALVFPATDVKEISRLKGDRVRVRSTFLGLYGIDSPLPYYFYDTLATEDPSTFAHRDFLDIFNHRLYAFFYRAWKKYRPSLFHRPDGRDAHSQRFLAVSGLGTPHATDDVPGPPLRPAALAGILGARARHAPGLKMVLKAYFKGMEVEIIENVSRWVPITEPGALGAGELRLGQNATIGERVHDRSGKFRVRLGPMELDSYLGLLPGGAQSDTLQRLVRLYAPDYLDYDVELRLRTDDLPPTQLGDPSTKLGLTTSLGQPTEPVLSRVVHYDT